MTILVKAAKLLLKLDCYISRRLAAARAKQAQELRERADGTTVLAHTANNAALKKAIAKHEKRRVQVAEKQLMGHDKADAADDKAITHTAQVELNERARSIL